MSSASTMLVPMGRTRGTTSQRVSDLSFSMALPSASAVPQLVVSCSGKEEISSRPHTSARPCPASKQAAASGAKRDGCFRQRLGQAPFARISSPPGQQGAAPAQGSSVARSSQPADLQESPLQLWLQVQLAKVPIFEPMVRQARLLSASRKAAVISGLEASNQAGLERQKSILSSAKSNKFKEPAVPPEDKPLWDMFVEMDINGDGQVDAVEMRTMLMRTGLPCSPAYVEQMLKQFEGEDDVVTWENFKHYVHVREQQIEEAFKAFDTDGNGKINAGELGRAMANAGLATTGRDIRKIMDVLDKDGDDSITYDEFRRWACMVPGKGLGAGAGLTTYAGWMRAAPAVASAAARRPVANLLSDPQQQFAAFDLLVRAALAGSLALMVLVALRQD